ncbi:uncharacterized protein LOC143461763 [Clavelina lepadiformis]|uniref:uncharacterized protein LOC143461763 n=1 Tax=Clavelina lepadiformis TaxID=159417 RepID=UPI0040414E49
MHCMLLFVLSYVCLASAGTRKVSNSDPTSNQMLTKDFLETTAFKHTVLSVVKEATDADVECKLKNGHFFYFSYTGRCENCALHCTKPTDGMAKECFSKCEDFMIQQRLQQQIALNAVQIKGLQEELASTQKDLEKSERKISSMTLGFFGIIGFVFVCVIGVVYGIVTYVNRNFSRRPPTNIHPKGDDVKFFPHPEDDAGYESVQVIPNV